MTCPMPVVYLASALLGKVICGCNFEGAKDPVHTQVQT